MTSLFRILMGRRIIKISRPIVIERKQGPKAPAIPVFISVCDMLFMCDLRLFINGCIKRNLYNAEGFMQYRKFGKTDAKVSALGYGCMRLPTVGGDSANINEEEAIRLIRYAIDHGVNYIDTAYPYHKGNSELLVGKALQDGYRERVYLATKSPVGLIHSYDGFERILNEQLQKLQTDHIDMYLLHAVNKSKWDKIIDLGVFKFLDQALGEGRIRYAGFSFHDKAEYFQEIVDAYPWTFCQIQYNYMDENFQAGKEGLEYAASKGMAVIVMEPLKGGKLAQKPPIEIEALWNQAEFKRTPVEWALRWVWNHPEVALLLSGMGEMEQVKENIKIAEEALPESLTENEINIIHKVKNRFLQLTKVGCTGCAYCLPCPSGVDIPRNFLLYNEAFIYNSLASSSRIYNRNMEEKMRASSCVECGKCELLCPQNLSIREYLKDVHKALSRT